jgi:hypothetical protein
VQFMHEVIDSCTAHKLRMFSAQDLGLMLNGG